MVDNAIYGWDTQASNNTTTADSTSGFPENMLAALVNNRARGLMARVAAFLDCAGGAATYGGSSNAYTITSPSGHAITSYAAGQLFMLVANHTCSGASTVNVDGLGAKAITKGGTTAMASGDIVSGAMYLMSYDGTRFQIINTVAGASFQPLDATLTAFAGLTISADTLPYGSGSDTFSTTTLTTFGRSLIDDADAATARSTLGLGTAATQASNAFEPADADLTAIAALSSTGYPIRTGSGTWVIRSFSAGAGLNVGNADGVANVTQYSVDFATKAEILANTANQVVGTDELWDAATVVTLTDAATIAVDMSTFINAKVTLGGNRTLGQPSNTKVGQSGMIEIIQDGTGSRTLAYHADWYFAGGTDPTLSTAAGARDLLFYQVMNDGKTFGSLVKAVA